MPPSIRIIMLGTGDFALPTFLHLLDTGHHVIALVTQPDRPQGRKQELVPSRIKVAATQRGVPVLQPEDVNAAESVAIIEALRPDLLVTAAYGQILSAELLSIPPLRGINLHGSILPAYRGAAPVARAIERGETETGVTVILMTPRIDAGGMLEIARIPIGPAETAGELEDRLAVLGVPLVTKAIADLDGGRAVILPQEKAKVTKAPKLRKEDGLIDWTRPVRDIHNLVRAMQPWPTAFASFNVRRGNNVEPIRVIVHATELVEGESSAAPGTLVESSGDRLIVATGKGLIRLKNIQVPGKKSMAAGDFLRGHALVGLA